MLKLNIEKLLEEKGKTKYWLWKQTNLTYTNFDNLIKNKTKSIRYENLEKICRVLDCTPSQLFVVDDSEDDDEDEDDEIEFEEVEKEIKKELKKGKSEKKSTPKKKSEK